MNNLKRIEKMWDDQGFKIKVVNAPKDAQTFDKMIIVFSSEKTIRRVSLYNSVDDKVVLEY